MVYIMVGIQGSGKSTYALELSKEKNCEVLSSDRMRMDFPGVPDRIIWPFLYMTAAKYVRSNKDFIFDATSITPSYRRRVVEEIERFGCHPSVGVVYVDTPLEVCKERVAYRNSLHTQPEVPLEVLDRYHGNLIPPSMEEGFDYMRIIRDGKIAEEYHK